ncbi:hypothetical protein PsYK624_065220 [Phanerochaete sordida]|uniref:Uncharacterized protein n=1 Tax=Phanerochaete sordida TaxID=48140 RepID=A0A9P3G8X8_9APHY|nr:hypothetical protein PsYK624_065220 [Phanerochaete sordida]
MDGDSRPRSHRSPVSDHLCTQARSSNWFMCPAITKRRPTSRNRMDDGACIEGAAGTLDFALSANIAAGASSTADGLSPGTGTGHI